jgi:ribosomal protein L44E
MNKRNELSEANLQDIDAEEVEKLIKDSTRSLQKLQKQFGSQTSGIGNILQIMTQELKKLNDMKPVIDVLCSKALKDRHWQQIKLITGA